MSDVTLDSSISSGCVTVVNVADIEAHVAKVKASWRKHERAMTWEQKIAVIERMQERSTQLLRAREKVTLHR